MDARTTNFQRSLTGGKWRNAGKTTWLALGTVGITVGLSGRIEAQEAPAAPKTGLRFGADMYFGASNAGGVRARNNDGIWAGYGSFYPSNLSLNWQGARTDSARVSVGVGDLYTAHGVAVKQPMEAYYTRPTNAANALTVGKYFVPFAGYEWEFESKWGAMLTGQKGSSQYAASLNWNPLSQTANGYLRLAKNFGPRTAIGVSGALGRGVMYGTSHNTAFAVDVAHNFGGLQFNSEMDVARSVTGTMVFGFGKLTWTRAGRWTPFVGIYSWRDSAGEMGAFRSVVAGTAYQIAPHMTLEAGIGKTGRRSSAFWLQSHLSL